MGLSMNGQCAKMVLGINSITGFSTSNSSFLGRRSRVIHKRFLNLRSRLFSRLLVFVTMMVHPVSNLVPWLSSLIHDCKLDLGVFKPTKGNSAKTKGFSTLFLSVSLPKRVYQIPKFHLLVTLAKLTSFW